MRARVGLLVLFVLVGCGEEAEPDPTETIDLLAAPLCPSDVSGDAAFATSVVSFTPGDGAGFGAELMPEVVLGAPLGAGDGEGGVDVVSLGKEGEIVVSLGAFAVDCEGPDLVIFENAFKFGNITFSEIAEVSVSADGVTWLTFDCDNEGDWPFEGCAGVSPVYAGQESEVVDPRDPQVSGGDAYDLADLGIPRVRFVKIRDLGRSTGPSGAPTRGFDLDAIAIPTGHAEALP